MKTSSWLRRFRDRLIRPGIPRPSRRRGAGRPALEQLEDRALPSVTLSGPPKVPEGTPYVLNLTADEPVAQWSIVWGDGSTQTVSGNPSTVSHTYAAGPNSYSVSASALVGGTSVAAQVSDGGRFLDAFVAAGSGGLNFASFLAFGPDANLYVSSVETDSVLRYDGTTRAFLDAFVPTGSGGLDRPTGLLFGSDGNLYVVSEFTDSVLRYNGATGAFLGAFVTSGSGGLDDPRDLKFGPDGKLYVSSWDDSYVLRYDGTTGAFLDTFVAAGSGGLAGANGLAFGPEGSLYVSSVRDDRVLRYNGTTGAFMGELVPSGYGGLDNPVGLTFGADGDLYVTSLGTDNVLRYEGTSGTFIDAFASGGGLDGTLDVAFGPDANLYVSGRFNNQVLRYAGPLAATAGTQLPVTVLDVVTYSNTAAQTIRDRTTITSTITVPVSDLVFDVNVSVNIDHTYDADLDVFLVSPAGTRVELFTDVGASGDHFRNTVLDDEARVSILSGAAPFTSTFRPEGLLSAFDGQSSHGVWTLEVTDDAVQNKGTLRSWSLSIARDTGGAALTATSMGQEAAEVLTPAQVQPLLTEAIRRWQAADLSAGQVAHLRGTDIRIADLGGATLGLASDSTIWLDDNAAGWGWFVDKTPWSDSEFTTPGNQGEQGRMDLLSVLVHEMGHVLGLEHDAEGVMQDSLPAGTRRLPTSEEAQAGVRLQALPTRASALAMDQAQVRDRVFAFWDREDFGYLATLLTSEREGND